MNSLVTQEKHLPSKIEDLSKFVLVGREKLTAVRAEIRAIDKIGLAKEVREQKRQEAQDLSEALLDAEARIGEILKSIPKLKENQYTKSATSQQCEKAKSKEQLTKELGFNKDMVQRFETLADNKDIIEQVKAEARENEDIPTRTEVLNRVKKIKQQEKRNNIETQEIKPLNGEYDVIYCDPPWKYDFAETENRAIENHYPTMELEDIKNIKVPSAENSVLFLWATAPKLIEALEVMNAWGYAYKTQSVWDKELIGSGYWFRGQHEILLVGVKGKFSPPIPENRESSVYREKRTQHSKKPTHYYEWIEKAFPNQRYLEMFSRNTFNEKWSVWGNQSE
jgi:N6-adenosine-specific RNA methylase IME4